MILSLGIPWLKFITNLVWKPLNSWGKKITWNWVNYAYLRGSKLCVNLTLHHRSECRTLWVLLEPLGRLNPWAAWAHSIHPAMPSPDAPSALPCSGYLCKTWEHSSAPVFTRNSASQRGNSLELSVLREKDRLPTHFYPPGCQQLAGSQNQPCAPWLPAHVLFSKRPVLQKPVRYPHTSRSGDGRRWWLHPRETTLCSGIRCCWLRDEAVPEPAPNPACWLSRWKSFVLNDLELDIQTSEAVQLVNFW